MLVLLQSNTLRDTMLTGRMGDPEQLRIYMTKFVEFGGVRVIVEVLQKCLQAECKLQWSAEESFGTQVQPDHRKAVLIHANSHCIIDCLACRLFT